MKDKILLIDFDSTFVTVESLDVLAEIVLRNRDDKEIVVNEIKQITRLGMEGKITFPESLNKRLNLFSPNRKHLDELVNLLTSTITPSFKRNKAFFERNAERIYILSGGFKEYMVPTLKPYGIVEDHILGNTFIFDSEGNIVGFDITNLLVQEKGKVKKIKEMNFKEEVYMIGDGFTDYEVKHEGLAKKFIAFTENVERKIVANNADFVARNFEEVLRKL